MIARPRFAVTVVLLGSLGVVVALLLVPPEDGWRAVAPVQHGMWKLRHAQWFAAPIPNSIGEVEEPVAAWRHVAEASDAPARFRELAKADNPVTQLYALAGLALHDSAAAAVLATELAADTTMIDVSLECRRAPSQRRVQDLTELASTPEFARVLLSGSAACP